MKQTERKKLKKKLDTLWSKLVKDKANNTCERCFSQAKRLNSHHLVSRRYIQDIILAMGFLFVLAAISTHIKTALNLVNG